jgi:hypothetical protein
MFAAYRVNGRFFNGTLERWLHMARVSVPARAPMLSAKLHLRRR